MKEYTLLALFSLLVTLIVDNASGVKILRRREFWILVIIITGFKFLVNGYLTAASIVMYDPRFFLGVRLWTIPIEDFFFGFSMLVLSIIFWEYFKAKASITGR